MKEDYKEQIIKAMDKPTYENSRRKEVVTEFPEKFKNVAKIEYDRITYINADFSCNFDNYGIE